MTTTVDDQMLGDVDVGIDLIKIKMEADHNDLNMGNYKTNSNEAEIYQDEIKSGIKQEKNEAIDADTQTHKKPDSILENFHGKFESSEEFQQSGYPSGDFIKKEYRYELVNNPDDDDKNDDDSVVDIKHEYDDEVEKEVDMIQDVDDAAADGKLEHDNKAAQSGTSQFKSIKSTTENTKLKCEICGKTFSNASHLKRHQVLHSGVKNYECNTCGKLFSLAGNLKTHQLTHSEVKNHQCQVCGKSFKRKGDFKRHLLIHSGEKNQCSICNKAYRRVEYLKKHKLSHSGAKN